MNNIQNVTIKLPKLKRKKVWLGYYFNHYNAIVIYHSKPIKNKEGIYNTYDNKKCIAGCTDMDYFKKLFPSANLSEIIDNKTGNVIEIESINLIEMYLTAFWDKTRLASIDFNFDGY